MKRGFTLIELIIVVIAVGILATIAVPQYLKAVERAKAAKAKHALGLVAQAEKMYRAEHDDYIDVSDGAQIDTDTTSNNEYLGAFVELSDVQRDCESGDWCVTVAATAVGSTGGTAAFTATATRTKGNSATKTITLDQDGTWGGTFPKDLGGMGSKE